MGAEEEVRTRVVINARQMISVATAMVRYTVGLIPVAEPSTLFLTILIARLPGHAELMGSSRAVTALQFRRWAGPQ